MFLMYSVLNVPFFFFFTQNMPSKADLYENTHKSMTMEELQKHVPRVSNMIHAYS